VMPSWALSAAFLFPLWPWREAAAHLAVLAFLGIILAEFTFDGVQRIPFTCSYLPGKSKLYLTFWLWIFLLVTLIISAALNERKALQSAGATAALLAGLGIAALLCMIRNNWLADSNFVELRYEEIPTDQLLSLDLS